MSLHTSWTISVPPLPPIPPSESSSNREALWSDPRNQEYPRYPMNLPEMRPQLALSDIRVAQDPSSQRLPPPVALRTSDVASTDPNYHCHSFVQQSCARRPTNLESGLRNSASPIDTLNCATYVPVSSSYDHLNQAAQLPQVSAHLPRPENSREQPERDHGFHSSPITSPTAPVWHPVTTYLSEPPRRSKAALAVEDWDHPSFARPPHRPIDCKPKPAVTPRIVHLPSVQGSVSLATQHDLSKQVEPEEMLVPNSYPVPPPPPFEQSAAPLSDLAAEMVWERCFNPRQHRSSSISPFMMTRVNSVNDTALSWGIPADYSSHYSTGYEHSSPQIGSQWDPALCDQPRGTSPANTFGAIGAEAKARRAHQQVQYNHGIKPLKTEAKPAFRRWTRQVLEQTLLSPQVLVLALYYVDAVSGKDVFGDANRCKASLVPYKILLAGLVLANKMLDDHSYKNSTFANVSSMTNKEVNTIEVAMLKALHFDTVPSLEEWRRWVAEVVRTGEAVGVGGNRSRKSEETAMITQLKHQQMQSLVYFSNFGPHQSLAQLQAGSGNISALQQYSM